MNLHFFISIYQLLISLNYQEVGTIQPSKDFSAEKDCETLMNAMKGRGANEDEIIDVIVHRSNAQRQEVVNLYEKLYGKVSTRKVFGNKKFYMDRKVQQNTVASV